MRWRRGAWLSLAVLVLSVLSLAPYLTRKPATTASINTPMQCCLKGVCLLNVDDVGEAVAEIERCAKLGHRGALITVYPGDVIVGDGEGVVCIPRHLVDEIAIEALDAFEYEAYAAQLIERGTSILDCFPATPESRAAYDQWVADGRPAFPPLETTP